MTIELGKFDFAAKKAQELREHPLDTEKYHQPGAQAGASTTRRPKYFDILEAADKILAARLAIQGLCDDICGIKEAGSKSDPSDIDPAKPCLLTVLDELPARIHQETQMIIGAVNEIRSQIL